MVKEQLHLIGFAYLFAQTGGTTKLFILPGTSPANNSNWIKNSDAYIKLWKDFFEY